MHFFPSSLCGTIPNLRLPDFPSWVEQSTLPLLPVLLRQNGLMFSLMAELYSSPPQHPVIQKGRCWIITLKFVEIQLCNIYKGTKSQTNYREEELQKAINP